MISPASSGRVARMRPQRKARWFSATAVPFSSMARSRLAWPSGSVPVLPGDAEHQRVDGLRGAEQALGDARCRAGKRSAPCRLPARSPAGAARRRRRGRGRAGTRRRPAGRGCRSPRPSCGSGPARPPRRATARSAASSRSASPRGMRTTSRPGSAICTCETTAPFFCARPVKSSVLTWRPSRWAAMATIWPQVTIPPPPMPANRPRQVSAAVERGLGQPGCEFRLALRPDRRMVHHRRRRGGAGGDEARAEALEAGEVGVAAGRADAALAAVVGVDRLDRDAVGLRGAVAAVLAHIRVDHHPRLGLRHLAALAAAALFGGADLVVDDGGNAGMGAHLALHRVHLVAPAAQRAGRQGGRRAAVGPGRRRRRRACRRLRRRAGRRGGARSGRPRRAGRRSWRRRR